MSDVGVLIAGAGAAGSACAEALREHGYDGSVILAGRDVDPPYERPYCSKSYLRGQMERSETYVPVPDDVDTAHPHQRDEARSGRPHGEAVERRRAVVRARRPDHRRERPAAARGRLRPRRHPLPAHARQLRHDPRRGRRGRERGPDRRLVHRLRGRCVADRRRQALHADHARGGPAVARLRPHGRRVLPGRAARPRHRLGRERRRSGVSRAPTGAYAASSPSPGASCRPTWS